MQYADFSEKLDAKKIDHKSGPEEGDAEINRPEDGTEHKKNQHKCDEKTRSDQPTDEPEDFQCNPVNDFIKILHDFLGKEKENRERNNHEQQCKQTPDNQYEGPKWNYN